MSRTLVFTSLFLVAIITGCQENTLTAPFDPPVAQTSVASIDPPSTGRIPLEGLIGARNGDDKELEYKITGQVFFSVTQPPFSPRNIVRVALATEAGLEAVHTGLSLKTAGESVDLVMVPGKTVKQFEKRYVIPTKDGGIVLCLQFVIAKSSMKLDRVWMERPGFGDRTVAAN